MGEGGRGLYFTMGGTFFYLRVEVPEFNRRVHGTLCAPDYFYLNLTAPIDSINIYKHIALHRNPYSTFIDSTKYKLVLK